MSVATTRRVQQHRRTGRQFRTFPARVKSVGEEQGRHVFEALVSVFGNIDAYGDRMMPGAFKDTLAAWAKSGDPIPVIWSHNWADPFAHVGEVLEAEERDEGLWTRGALDDDTDMSRQVYRLLKGRRVKEFSFAFDYVDVEPAEDDGEPELDDWGWPVWNVNGVKLYEVGPCLVGANDSTQLYEVRAGRVQRRKAIASHSTETSTSAWDGPAAEAGLSNDDGAEVYRTAYAWNDPEGDPDKKASYKFIHHFVSDGTPGAASTVGCTAGIAVLNGGRGGADIPDADRQGVWNHLARHLRDADIEPAELRALASALLDDDLPPLPVQYRTRLAAMVEGIDRHMAEVRALLDGAPVPAENQRVAEPGQPAQRASGETDGKPTPSATRGPAAWMSAFEALGQQESRDGHRAGDRAAS